MYNAKARADMQKNLKNFPKKINILFLWSGQYFNTSNDKATFAKAQGC